MIKRRVVVISVLAFIIIALMTGYYIYLKSDLHDYHIASNLRDSGEIEDAIHTFQLLDDFKDSENQAFELRYQVAEAIYESGHFVAASDSFLNLDGFSDSVERSLQIRYDIAEDIYESGHFVAASDSFLNLDGFSDSVERSIQIRYDVADSLYISGELEEAVDLFSEITNFEDSQGRVISIGYEIAQALLMENDYENSYYAFLELGEYSGSNQLADSIGYIYASQLLYNLEPVRASNIFEDLGNYRDSRDIYENLQTGRFRYMMKEDTIVDCVTGLEWLVGRDSTTTWFTAESWVKSLSTGWRMPSSDELEALYHSGITEDNWGYFENSGRWVWSGEVKQFYPWAYAYRFNEGTSGYQEQANPNDRYDEVRSFAVRNPNSLESVAISTIVISPLSERFSVSGNVITDNETSLQWRVGPDIDTSWYTAKRWVDNLGGAWRLPSLNELRDLNAGGVNRRESSLGPFYNTGYDVWTDEHWWAREGDTNPSQAYYYNFSNEDDYRTSYSSSWNYRVFAVR